MKLKNIISLIFMFLFFLFYPLSAFANADENSQEFDTSAKSAILIDKDSGKILFEKNPSEVVYTASLMKMMNLMLAFDMLDDGKISLKDEVNIKNNIPNEEGSNVFLKSGEKVTVEDLIKSISMVSANDACYALADYVCGNEGKFISEMNERAIKMDLKNTIFKNSMGLDIDGNVSTAHDLACMAKKLLEYENITSYTSKWIDHIRNGNTQLVNTNKLLKTYPGTLGLKTGTSKEAGSCACIYAQKNGLSLIAVVLGCESTKERNEEIIKILEYGFSQYVISKPPIIEIQESIEVENGVNDKVGIEALKCENFLISNKNKEKISSELILDEKLEAPVTRGKKVGEIVYRQGKDIVCISDVVTSQNVDKRNFRNLMEKFLKNFFTL